MTQQPEGNPEERRLISDPSVYNNKAPFLLIAPVVLIYAIARSAPGERIAIAIVSLIWFGICLAAFGRNRKVWLSGNELIVKHYRREVRVPVSAIRSVSQFVTRTVEVTFDPPSEIGRSITFVPRRGGSHLRPWAPHDIVKELRDLAASSGGGKDVHTIRERTNPTTNP